MLEIFRKSKWFVLAILFAFCVAPTFISYQPYLFEWDDAGYLVQSILVSRAFWSGSVHGLGAMVGIRPPAMALLGLPWGPLISWEAAGRCFVTLAAVISLLAALCLYLLLRIGVKPVFLIAASMCVLASMGPYPPPPYFFNLSFVEKAAAAHFGATAFLADSLFAWTTLAAVLLIPYETRTHYLSFRGAVARGMLWGLILSLGAMTKLNFLYFVLLVVPALVYIRLRRGGLRSTLAALVGFACASAPSALYLVRWGRPAFENVKAASFGRDSHLYFIPLVQFLRYAIRESPGLVLSSLLTVGALSYLVIKRRRKLWWPDVLAVLIMIGFATLVVDAPNREIRFAFPAIVALPFLTAILMSDKTVSASARSATLPAALVFCGLVVAGVPTRHRPSRQSLNRSDAVLAQAAACNAKSILLATDSPTLNQPLTELAIQVSTYGGAAKDRQVSSLAYDALSGVPIEDDFYALRQADQVVLQDSEALSPPFTNQRVEEYERYMRRGGYVPIRVGDDVRVYSMRCRR